MGKPKKLFSLLQECRDGTENFNLNKIRRRREDEVESAHHPVPSVPEQRMLFLAK